MSEDTYTPVPRNDDGEPKEPKVEREETHEYVGIKDYKRPADIIWFTLGNKSFPTKMVNSWIIMKLAKAQNDQNEMAALSATMDLLQKLIPKKYRLEFDEHMSDIEYEDEELNSQIELVMNKWTNKDNHSVAPLVQKKQSPGSPMPPSESPTFKEVSFSSGEVKERPLTEEEMAQYQNEIAHISMEDLEKTATSE